MDSQTICDFNNGCFATNIGKGVQNLTLRRGCGRQLGDHVFDTNRTGFHLAVSHSYSLS